VENVYSKLMHTSPTLQSTVKKVRLTHIYSCIFCTMCLLIHPSSCQMHHTNAFGTFNSFFA